MKANGKIEAMNTAIREAIPALQQEAGKNPRSPGAGARPAFLPRRAMAHRRAHSCGGREVGGRHGRRPHGHGQGAGNLTRQLEPPSPKRI